MIPYSHVLQLCKQFALLFFFLAISLSSYSQLGPGGVSHETPNTQNPTQSDVRLWLDASSLTTLADGDPVYIWDDISHSAINDKGFRQNSDNFLPPYFRDDPSAAINGYPVVTFEDGRMLKVNSSNDLNTSIKTTYEQTIIFAFRTSEDVTTRQILWEEGGTWRGINVFIYNGEIYLGAYDNHVDNDPGVNVPDFGYNYVKSPIQPNTTYILSHIFSAPTNNTLTGEIKGYQNGSYFGTLNNSGHYNSGIGGVFRHPDPIGIGAVNSGSFNETGPITGTGNYAFRGRLAEICYYNRLLNDAERIIVENYLGAKYYANIIVNDKYAHQADYGKDVIGIGQTSNSITTRHSVSQGRNPFEISPFNVSTSFNAPNKFLLVGSNGLPLTLTEDNVPNDPGSTKRTERIWRFDETGDLLHIKFRFHISDLPPLPVGFTKHILIFDETSPNFPSFSTSNSKSYEIADVGGGFYEAKVNVIDGAFMTIGVLKPQVSFLNSEAFAIEGNPSPDSTVYVNKVFARLNYIPTSTVKVDFSFTDGTASRSTDYGYMNGDVNNGISFAPGQQQFPIRLYVKNDLILEDNPSTESFYINLEIGSNTTPGLGLGTPSQHTFTIYDNDPPPKLSFAQSTSQTLESVGSHSIDIVRTGSTVGTASVKIKINLGASTTAVANADYSYPAYKTVNFAAGESIKSVTVDILDDDIDEVNEFIKFQIYDIVGAGSEASSILFHTVEILDDDLPPTVEFTSATSQNYETNGSPLILIELDKVSSKPVSVTYTKTDLLASAATYGSDYELTYPATIIIPPGDTLGNPVNFFVQQDGIPEDDETVEFEITSAVNANIGTNTRHVYTIKDYSTFEWKGVAGVGKDSDNIFWLDVNRQSGSHDSPLQTLTNFTPHNINISQNTSSKRANIQTTSNLINGKKTMKFDGLNDLYKISNSGLINTAPYVVNKSYFLAIRTGSEVTSWQTIYKQGGSSRGLAIYIQGSSLYFHAWNNPNDGPESEWGAGAGDARFARFDGMLPNTNYVVECLFDKDATEKIRIYVNGQIGQKVETESCGRIYSHTGAPSIGGAEGNIIYHDNSIKNGRFFKGYLAEMIHFNDAPVNQTRRIILENYLSGKYNIALSTGQIITLNTGLDYDIAGIGQINAGSVDAHTDSQGSSILRVKTPTIITDNSFAIWGHNNVPLSEIWPWSNANLPTGIVERSGRVWHFSKRGTINGFQILIRYNTLLNSTNFGIGDLKLLIHGNADPQNFTGARVLNASEIMSGSVVKFNNVSIGDGEFLALANTSIITPLPIELLTFEAAANGSVTNLTWITSTEINNEFFEIERAGSDLKFENIITVNGAGTSNRMLFYSEIDKEPLPGMNYYRLKQIDYDGEFEYSDVISVLFDKSQTAIDNFDFIVYPNPTNGDNQIHIISNSKIGDDTEWQVQLISTTGSVLLQLKYHSVNAFKTIYLPSGMSSGAYLITLSNNQFTKTQKLIVN